MKTYSNLYDKCLDREFIKAMIIEAAKGKKDRVDVRRVLEKVDHYVEVFYSILLYMTYRAHIPRATIINEGTRPKKREIRKIRFFDQVIHHIVVKACYEVFTRSMYEFCCGSVPDRGIHYGKRYIERWIRNDNKNTKYCCQMDIRHYFDSVDHEVLKRLLRHKITDRRMLWLLDEIIDSCETGIPLGYYTSQWFANFFLEGLDHYIKEQLHVKYYVRYLDDMVIFGRNKKELHKARAAIAAYLENNLRLQMKGNYQVFRLDYITKAGEHKGRALDFMGFRFWRDRTTLRKSLMLRICRKAKRIGRKPRPTYYDAAAMLSYMGWIKNSDTYRMYEERIKPQVSVKQMKQIVSKNTKNQEKEKPVQCGQGFYPNVAFGHCWGGFWQPADWYKEQAVENCRKQCSNCKFYKEHIKEGAAANVKNRLEGSSRKPGKEAHINGHDQQPDNGIHS